MPVALTYPTECSAEGCREMLPGGLLMCLPHCRRLSEKTKLRYYKELRRWRRGASVQGYVAARDAAIREAAGAAGSQAAVGVIQ